MGTDGSLGRQQWEQGKKRQQRRISDDSLLRQEEILEFEWP